MNPDEFVCGFRRDSTYSSNIFIKDVNWFGRTAIKQYKEIGGYSFHLIVTSDGWAMGTGGADSASINRAIENIAGSMVKSKSMPVASVKKIMGYLKYLGIGHFAIKSPYGGYVAVWKDSYRYGKINPGQYISVPNYKSYFREGNYDSFGKTPSEIGIKIGATDKYGTNRREVIMYHWKAITTDGSTVSHVATFAANDNGKLKGLSTAHLIDNIYYKNTFYSKNVIPQASSSKYLGYHDFGRINYLKEQAVVNASALTTSKSDSQNLKVKIVYKSNNKPIKGLSIKINLYTGNTYKTYTFKTNNNGEFIIKTHFLNLGYHKVFIYSGNRFYHVCLTTGINIT